MQRTSTLGSREIVYTVRVSKRARRMRLSVYRDGSVVVTLPLGAHEKTVEAFLRQKAEWVIKKIAFFKTLPASSGARHDKVEYAREKARALVLAQDRVAHFNFLYRFAFRSIRIRNQKTRWGSCSRKGNLNFNYKIVFLPERARDYVIVHELCHLKQMNHSQKFWDLVSQVFPDYREIRKELKRFGAAIV